MNENLIYYYLIGKTQIINLYSKIKRYFVETNQVVGIDDKGNRINYLYRYYLIRFLNYCVGLLQYILSRIDVSVKKMEVVKEYESGTKTAIIDASVTLNKNSVTVDDIIKHMESNENSKNFIDDTIFLTFELRDSNEETGINNKCLKDYTIKYRDHEKLYAHTLENIFTFNGITTTDSSEIHITFFKGGKRISSIIPYNKCKDRHISDFCNDQE